MQSLKRTNSENADFHALVAQLDADLRIRDGEDHAFFAQFNKIDKIRNVVLFYVEEKAVGCGAFKEYAGKTVEIKRMFVEPNFRGKGIAAQILAELEVWAAELHYNEAILETGIKQPEAIRLYQKMGYQRIPNYGQYEQVETSVCMQKSLLSSVKDEGI
jgi:GNAT superfamily N-acetyltransferase